MRPEEGAGRAGADDAGDGAARPQPVLVVITDVTVAPGPVLLARVAHLAGAARRGTVMVQLRDRQLTSRERLALGVELLRVCRASGQALVVNDRMDLAVLLGADGVHLGEGSVDPGDARRLLAPGAFVSVARHEPAGVVVEGADAVLLSPIVAPRKGRRALGLQALGEARRRLDDAGERGARDGTPPADGARGDASVHGAPHDDPTRARPARLIALGGVDGDSAAACLAAGADGVAVIGAALDGRDPAPLLDALGILV